MLGKKIPIACLNENAPKNANHYSELVLKNEIAGIQIEHQIIVGGKEKLERTEEAFRMIFLFIKGKGILTVEGKNYSLQAETIFLPNDIKKVSIRSKSDESLQYLKITCKLSDQDILDLKEFPKENTQQVYLEAFKDCPSYSEPIKSPNTISRTILPNKYIPRVALGTVQTMGPDEVAAHKHPMLEQLFLGLSKNKCVVYADNDKVEFPEFSVIHIPLGSTHSVTVEKDEVMYYVWMDFFLDKKGEEWLKTHIED